MSKSSVNRGVLQTTSAGAVFWYIDIDNLKGGELTR